MHTVDLRGIPRSLTSWWDSHRGASLRDMMHTTEFLKNLNILAKSKPLENTLPCLSGEQMGSNHEKNRGRKSRETLPLTKFAQMFKIGYSYYSLAPLPLSIFSPSTHRLTQIVFELSAGTKL